MSIKGMVPPGKNYEKYIECCNATFLMPHRPQISQLIFDIQ